MNVMAGEGQLRRIKMVCRQKEEEEEEAEEGSGLVGVQEERYFLFFGGI